MKVPLLLTLPSAMFWMRECELSTEKLSVSKEAKLRCAQ
jgi:hypothetical protein